MLVIEKGLHAETQRREGIMVVEKKAHGKMQRGKDREVNSWVVLHAVGDALDTFFHKVGTEIQNEAQPHIGESEIG